MISQNTTEEQSAADDQERGRRNDKDTPVGDFNRLARKRENLLILMCAIWVFAMISLSFAAVVLSKRPKMLLRSAAIYTIAAASLHLFFLRRPKFTSVSETKVKLPMWYKQALTASTLFWIPVIVIMSVCYQRKHNYAHSEDDPFYTPPRDESAYDNGWLHRRLVVGNLGSHSADPLDNFALGASIAGLAAFLGCLSLWLQVYGIQAMKWEPQAIVDVQAGKTREKAYRDNFRPGRY